MSDPNNPPEPRSPHVVVVGAGPAGLAAAETLATAGVKVVVADRMANPARKFLLAGRGGLNLTHSEPLEVFLDRYGEARAQVETAIRAFPPQALRTWCEGLGVETFVGSSGRVFPKAMKASPLLRAWLKRLDAMEVTFQPRWLWQGWTEDGALRFETSEGVREEACDAAVFALGGASWPRLGSDGSWVDAFRARGAVVSELKPANGGFLAPWSDHFRQRFAGEPLKSARLTAKGAETRGEAMITDYGIEGGAIYALSRALREALEADGVADLMIDLAPLTGEAELAQKLASAQGQSVANRLRRAGLSPLAAGLMRESLIHAAEGPTALPSDADRLARLAKRCAIRLSGAAPIARAISTAGGIGWASLAPDFSLKGDPSAFVCGEMLDWEAPTGGYLLQACFATGRAAAEGVLARLRRQ